MKAVFAIIFSIVIGAGFGQKKNRFLIENDFQDVALDESWIIVKYKSQAKYKLPQQAKVLSDRSNVSSARKTSQEASVLDGMIMVPVEAGQHPLLVCNEYLKDQSVLYAEPIIMDRPLETVSDPLSSSQYHLENIRALDAWDITTGDDDITIGIIDTGVDLDHEDLQNQLWINEDDPIDGVDNDENGYIDDYYGYDFADSDNDPDADQTVHGARVAGIAGASTNNGIGVAGVGYNTKIAALKGFQSESGFSAGLFEAILYAANNGIDVLNLSWGSIRSPLQSEQDIIDYAVLEKDVIIVAAAGNDGGKATEESKFYPASYEHVLSVAGSNSSDQKWSGSTFNFQVDITAPGAAIVSTTTGNGYHTSGGYGTSFAAPMVAAAAALVKDQFPELSALQIMERVRATADDIYDIGSNSQYEGKLGKGRLNVYRAVSDGGVKSLRAESPELISSNGEYVFYGDTVMATFQLTNFLSQVNNPSLYITSADNEFEVSQGSFFPGLMSTLDKQEVSFEVVLSDSLAPESTVGIRLDISDGAYTDFQYLDVTTSPDHVDFGNDNMALTIEGNGGLGVGNNRVGPGLLYHGDTLLTFGGIMMATSEGSVSDNIISDFEEFLGEDDFSTAQYYKLWHHPSAANFGYSEFVDADHGIKVEQSNIASDSGDFILIRYRIVNQSEAPISNLSFGVYTDWDLRNYQENYSAYDTSGLYLYTRSSSSDLFAGTKTIGTGAQTYSALNLDNLNGNPADIDAEFSDQEKFDFLVNQNKIEAGNEGPGNDVAGIHGITIDQIEGYGDHYVNVIFGVGNSQTELESIFASAEAYLDETLDNPRVLEVFYTCDGSNVVLDPSNGEAFEFYQDPRGVSLLDSASSYATGTITQDTSFYVRNTDNNFRSDLFEVRILLLNDFADFELSEDTLYLDDSNVTIDFMDKSINASSWSWDFGQGSFSSLQNPILSLSEAGTYTVTLTVENEQGCSDTIQKNVIVAKRPEAIQFDDYLVCPGELISISHPTASSLKVYTDAQQTTPLLESNAPELGPFYSDTTLYLSAVIDGFETEKSTVQINTHIVEADFTFSTDTTSTAHQIVLNAYVDDGATIRWTINGADSGSDAQIIVSTESAEIDAQLEVTSSDGCVVIIDKSFTVSTSATPIVTDAQSCLGDTVFLAPSNGIIFGFYEDAALTNLIKKSTHLEVTEATKLYVVGLDDGLPGDAVEVDVTFADFSPQISYSSSVIGGKNKVELSIEATEEVIGYQWFVEGELVENSAAPILFFDDVLTTIVAEVTSSIGCIRSDTLNLDFTPPAPLSVQNNSISVFPNPVLDILNIQVASEIHEIELTSLSGELVKIVDVTKSQVDLRDLSSGIYILSLKQIDGEIAKFKIVKE